MTTPPNQQQPSGFFDQFSPKAAFLFGLVLAVAVMSMIGFGISLWISDREGTPKTAKTEKTNTNGSANTNAPAQLSYRPVDKNDHIRGSEKASVTLIEYSDLECPFCKRVHPTLQQVMKDYDGKVRWVYRHLPLTSLHSKAVKEALAAECAGAQDKFWEYIDIVYERTPSNNGLEESKLTEFATELTLDTNAFQKCLSDETYSERVQSDIDDAQQAGAQGTPYSLIIDKKGNVTPVSGALPYSEFKKSIDEALAG